jgi:hypothetical protein
MYDYIHVCQTSKECFAAEQQNKETQIIPKPAVILIVFERAGRFTRQLICSCKYIISKTAVEYSLSVL